MLEVKSAKIMCFLRFSIFITQLKFKKYHQNKKTLITEITEVSSVSCYSLLLPTYLQARIPTTATI
jgi:hypothetical protein